MLEVEDEEVVSSSEIEEDPSLFLHCCLVELFDRDEMEIVDAVDDEEVEVTCDWLGSSESHEANDFSEEHEAFNSFLISKIFVFLPRVSDLGIMN